MRVPRLLLCLVLVVLAGCSGGDEERAGPNPREATETSPSGDEATAGSGGGGAGESQEADQEASGDSAESKKEEQGPELPRGGRDLLPKHRIVALYGAPQAAALGALGQGSPAEAAQKAVNQAGDYKGEGRPVMPALELITVIANEAPGGDGLYRTRQDEDTIRDYHEAAQDEKALLILDIQPGRAEFIDEVQHLRKWLEKPDVGLAIDPEWSMGPGEVPGQSIGSTDAATINKISAYVDDLVSDNDLPEKVMIVHRFTQDMIEGEEDIESRDNVVIVEMADGFGAPQAKISKYRNFTGGKGDGLEEGFKLFYEEDTNLMSVDEVMDLRPKPDVLIYE